jgi:hypothetical protein
MLEIMPQRPRLHGRVLLAPANKVANEKQQQAAASDHLHVGTHKAVESLGRHRQRRGGLLTRQRHQRRLISCARSFSASRRNRSARSAVTPTNSPDSFVILVAIRTTPVAAFFGLRQPTCSIIASAS